MSNVHPTVRYLIVCDDVQHDPQKARPISLIGLVGTLVSPSQPPFPCVHPELCVYLQLTECRGPAHGHIEVQHADSGNAVYRSKTVGLTLSDNPLALVGFTFRIRQIRFPEPGLYWFQFWYNNDIIAQQPVIVR